MTYTSARSLIAGLGFTLVAASALAQTSVSQPTPPSAAQPSVVQETPAAPMPGMGLGSGMVTNPDMRLQMQQGAGPHGSMQRPHQAAAKGGGEGPMGQVPQAVIDRLALAPAQQAQFDTAQAARKELQTVKQSLRAEQRKAMDEQLTKDIVDPRAIIAQQKKMRTTLEAKMEVVQQKWLAFWDGLSAPQKTTLSNYMKSKHAAHTQKKPAAAKG
ncbi:MAG: hypothetical protein CK528_10845 [Alcaligenaceae bacterium]|nr:MAG: hypothetical protein CK528_10845 [Alcaligenaceae bacterium]